MAKNLPSGHTYEEIDEEELEYMKARNVVFSEGGIKMQPGDYYLPKTFLKYAERYYNFEDRLFVIGKWSSGV
ncbi:hypothetical protein Avbf_16461 [Armadillidium vulgare]|nr:hypothetical protein Avbf_16461 [Armadillidium vulgare]